MSGRNVMMGYLFCPEKTQEAIDADGWLHSGNLHTQREKLNRNHHHIFPLLRGVLTYYYISYIGDIGCIDSKGYLRITGRIKELIITAGGENVPPLLIEDAIKEQLPCISNVMVVGDKKKFLSCLLTMKGKYV